MWYGVCVCVLLLTSLSLPTADQTEYGVAEDCRASMLQNSLAVHSAHGTADVETEASQFGREVGADRCSGSQELVALPGELETKLAHNLALDQPKAPDLLEKRVLHDARVAEARSLDSSPLSLIFYGDSIMEMWREEIIGSSDPESPEEMASSCSILNSTGFKGIFQERLVAPFGPAAVMAVSGDTTAELLWRLQNGESFTRKADAVMVHIGINDIGGNLGGYSYLNPCKTAKQQTLSKVGSPARPRSEFGSDDADNVYFGIKAVVQQILNCCQAPVVLTGLFPTGVEWPAGPFGAVVPRVNSLLQNLSAANSDRFHFIDCSWAVLNNETGKIDPELMPDYLHPSLAGGARWADCMSQALECKVFETRTC